MAMGTSTTLVRPHIVHFYENDADLARAVSAYALEGLSGGSVILIATPVHMPLFVAGIGDHGADPKQLITLDASQTLARFMVDGAPDPAAFDAVVGSVVRGLAAEGAVAAYGEMVAVLWDQGNVTGALALEELWNDLLREVDFSLFCAYPTAIIEDGQANGVLSICQLHSEVHGHELVRIEGVPVERNFEGSLASLGPVRAFVRDVLAEWSLDGLLVDASLVGTELATNAVIHAESDFTVSLSRRVDGTVRLGVRDGSNVLPARRDPSPSDVSGRGLLLISNIATIWDADLVYGGKIVWADLHANGKDSA